MIPFWWLSMQGNYATKWVVSSKYGKVAGLETEQKPISCHMTEAFVLNMKCSLTRWWIGSI